VNRHALDALKQQIPLLDYLRALDWQQARPIGFGRVLGLCPLHDDHKPSLLVDPHKNLFYCYGCRRGGDVIRFAELYHQVEFPQAVALLNQWRGLPPLLHEAAGFYRMQLHRHAEAVAYLCQRGICSPEVIEHMRIGYAPGGCLRGWLTQLGYPFQTLRQAGLATASGYDTYRYRVVFPLEGNLYGRSLSAAASPHRFLPGAKGGLYSWDQVRLYPEVILVEGLFDYAALWQAGFLNVTCSMGTNLNARQFRQLCDGPRTVYLAFDADTNGSGQQAAQSLVSRLGEQGVNVRTVSLPELFYPGWRCASVPVPAAGGAMMTFRVVSKPSNNHVHCPYRIIDKSTGREIEWINQYLDYETLRRLADATLRTYAHELLHFLRWWESVHHTDAVTKDDLTESTLLDYVRFQSSQERELTGATINQRVAIVDRALRIAFPGAPGQIAPALQSTYWQRAPMGIGKPRPALSRLRVKTAKRTIVPLSVDEVARFWSSFRNSRDLAIVGLMLLQGLRSQEVLDLRSDDLLLSESQIRVRGKGNKTRFLPLAPEAMELLDHYLRLERPQTSTDVLFVSLKGSARGSCMTAAGLRSLFRYHRRSTGVKKANPHRFRHTFASDMVRAGVSLPALMQLMGHARIETTMVYVEVTPLEVYQQYPKAVAQHIRPAPGSAS
jgi:integrase/recombinase XerD